MTPLQCCFLTIQFGATGGGVAIVGTTTNDSANTGQIGELVTSQYSARFCCCTHYGVAVILPALPLGFSDWDVTDQCIPIRRYTSYTN